MSETAIKTPRNKWPENPGYQMEFIASPKRVRVDFGGETIADSTRVMLLREQGHLPVYYFPRDDVRMDLLKPTDHHTHCPYKGHCSYFSIEVGGEAGGRMAENAVWSYEDPYPEQAAIKDYLAFYWDRVDRWREEDEEVFVHARDPKKRIDVLESHREVRVVIGGTEVARTTRARFLFETGLQTRYYIPPEDVRMDLLEPSPTRSSCPYKGDATYYHARIGGSLHEDIAWCYPAPRAEVPQIRGSIAFFDERADDILVDGTPVEKVRTKWSRADRG